MKYLTPEQTLLNLRVGKPLEQWLGLDRVGDDVVLRWVRVERQPGGNFAVTTYEAFDDPDGGTDLYGRYAVDSDSDGPRSRFSEPERALPSLTRMVPSIS
jgi:hypothetical protein